MTTADSTLLTQTVDAAEVRLVLRDLRDTRDDLRAEVSELRHLRQQLGRLDELVTILDDYVTSRVDQPGQLGGPPASPS